MRPTERNVDLIIRAREDAAKAVKTVNTVLEELTALQKGAAFSAADMSKKLGLAEDNAEGLAAALSTKTAQAVKIAETGYKRVAAAVDTARKAHDRQGQRVQQAEDEYNALRAQLKAAEKAVESFRIRNEAAMDDRFQSKLKAAEAGYRALERQVSKADVSLSKQQQGLADTESNLARVEQAAIAAEIAYKKLQERQAHQANKISAAEQKQLAQNIREAGQATAFTEEKQRKLTESMRRAITEMNQERMTAAQLTRAITFMSSETDRASNVMRRNAAEATNMRRALGAFYGDSRRALSLMQRLRGEVLSLTASFVGFYGIWNTGQSFLDAFNIDQAATNRLGAAFEQDADLVKSEIAFIRTEAARLGIQFGVLADSYSKFLISGKQAGIETSELRKIFRQVTEAGRVLKLSNEQIEGTLVALSQIAGKGTLQMEELRQQLGDRLPGAVGLVAKALGYGTDELADFYKAVENGQVGARDALIALGQGLEDTYGDQLEEALDATATKVGALQNLLFERQLTAANSGFIDGLETALDALNAWLESDEGIRFFEAMGAAFGELFRLLPGVLNNMDLIVVALKAFVAIKAAQVASGLAGNMANVNRNTFATRRQVVLFNRAVAQMSPTMGAAIRKAGVFGGTLRGLRGVLFSVAAAARATFASLGGPIGIAVAALSYFAVSGVGEVDEATAELDQTLREHEQTLARIRGAYLSAKDSTRDWKEELEDLTQVEVEAQLTRLRRQLEEFRSNPSNTLSTMRGNAPEVRAKLLDRAQTKQQRELIQSLLDTDEAFHQARIGARQYHDAIEEFHRLAPDLLPAEFLDLLLQVAKQGLEIEESIGEAEAALRLMSGTASEADLQLLGLAESTDESAKKGKEAAQAYDEYAAAMRKLAEHVPALQKELDRFDALGEIALDFEQALAAIEKMPEALREAARAKAELVRQDATNAFYADQVSGFSGGNGAEVAASFIREREGYRASPYWDVNAYRAGYGSDTVTLADGTIQKVVQGMSVSVSDANRDLLRRISTEFMPAVRSAVGGERFDALTPQAQAALTSLAYNYGAGAFAPGESLAGVAEAVRTGSTEGVAAAIQALGGHNDGINRDRRNMEAALFSSNAGHDAIIDADRQASEEAARVQERRIELAGQFNERIEEQIANAQFELSIQQLALQDREVAKALREAETAAQKAGTELSAKQREEIEKATRAKFAQQAADETRNAKLEEARKIEEQITLLQERRRFTQDRITQLEQAGDFVGAANAQTELEAVDAKLEEMIQKAMDFWQALGGEGSESALQGLRFAQTELRNVETQVVTTGRQMNDFFADTATAAIDRFAQRVANGESVLKAFAAEFRQMAAEILIEIGKMILRQAIFNAISGMFGGGASGMGGLGGGAANLINGLFHGGGIAGNPQQTRTTSAAAFANAIRYHTGGIAGLAPDEVPAVLREGEEILTEADPRHRYNGGRMPQDSKRPFNIINAIDAASFLEAALAEAEGSEVFMNFLKANSDEVTQVLA